jgi:hypothetical protein
LSGNFEAGGVRLGMRGFEDLSDSEGPAGVAMLGERDAGSQATGKEFFDSGSHTDGGFANSHQIDTMKLKERELGLAKCFEGGGFGINRGERGCKYGERVGLH